jgi:hypothetical protein
MLSPPIAHGENKGDQTFSFFGQGIFHLKVAKTSFVAEAVLGNNVERLLDI